MTWTETASRNRYPGELKGANVVVLGGASRRCREAGGHAAPSGEVQTDHVFEIAAARLVDQPKFEALEGRDVPDFEAEDRGARTRARFAGRVGEVLQVDALPPSQTWRDSPVPSSPLSQVSITTESRCPPRPKPA